MNLADPTSIGLRLVDCHDFTTFLDGNVYTQVRVVLEPPSRDFRQVAISGIVRMDDCDCEVSETSHDRENHSLLLNCLVSPLDPVGTFHIEQNVLCADEIGIDFTVRCEWQSDRSVRVSGNFKFYEEGENTCGAEAFVEDEPFDFVVAEGATEQPFMHSLVNEGFCSIFGFPVDCDDSTTIDDFTVTNDRAP